MQDIFQNFKTIRLKHLQKIKLLQKTKHLQMFYQESYRKRKENIQTLNLKLLQLL